MYVVPSAVSAAMDQWTTSASRRSRYGPQAEEDGDRAADTASCLHCAAHDPPNQTICERAREAV